MVLLYYITGDKVEVVTDFGGRIETLQLRSKLTNVQRDILLGHNGNSTAIVENQFWKGMMLIPWANRIAYVNIIIVMYIINSLLNCRENIHFLMTPTNCH